jgi:hypothetical protein
MMLEIKRNEVRHLCSQKAVLLNEDGAGSLCVITNISRGGLCVALVGSSKTPKLQRIEMKVKRGSFLCNIVNRREGELHCSFDFPILQLPFYGVVAEMRLGIPILER